MTADEKYMREAIKQAKKAYAIGEVPIGCVIVMRRIYFKSVADATVQSSGRAYNRGSGRRMQSDDENIF